MNYLDENGIQITADDFSNEIIQRNKQREKDFENAREKGASIKSNKPMDITIPHFDRKLRDFQVMRVQHMIEVPNVANFSIPGSGKTTMAYAAYSVLKDKGIIDQLFVVGPLPSFKPWEDEYRKCFGVDQKENIPVIRYTGTRPERKKLLSKLNDYEVVLTGFQTASNDEDDLAAHLFSGKKIMMIIDESHHIKSFAEDATYANAMIHLGKRARKRVILTGTPLPHGWKDLWSQFTFLEPDFSILGSRFIYKDMIERPNVASTVSKKIQEFWTRVSQNDMTGSLPEIKTRQINVKMSPLQQEIYNALEGELAILENQEYDGLLDLQELKRVKILRLLQCTTNPAAIRKPDIDFDLEPYQTDNKSIMDKLETYNEVPEKMKKVATLAKQLVEQEKNVVIWTVFRHNVNYLYDMLEEMKPIPISGQMPQEGNKKTGEPGRDDFIDEFKNSKGRIMIATMGSMAESVSLHRNQKDEPVCQNAIYLERSFNAGQFMQSIFRIYRIGSDPKIPVTNTFLTSVYNDGFTRTIDDAIHDRLKERSNRMFRLMNDPLKLIPIDLQPEEYTVHDKAQIFDSNPNEEQIVRKKILDMIKKHQKKTRT